MNTRKTKSEMLADNQRLGAENYELRKQLGDLKLALAHKAAAKVYPLTDKIGRSYRLEGRVRCYPAGH